MRKTRTLKPGKSHEASQSDWVGVSRDRNSGSGDESGLETEAKYCVENVIVWNGGCCKSGVFSLERHEKQEKPKEEVRD